jgi:hypothetical protein
MTKKRKGTILLLKKSKEGGRYNLHWEEAEEASLYCKKKRHITEDKEKQLRENS